MKYLILSSALLCAVSADAQKFIAGINAGASVSGNFKEVPNYYLTDGDMMKNNIDPVVNVRFGVRKKATEYGCLVSVSRFSQMIDDRYIAKPEEGYIIPRRKPFNGYVRYNLAEQALSVQFYVNQHLTLGKFDMYGGIALGQGKFFVRNSYIRSQLELPGQTGIDDNTLRTANTFTSSIMCGLNYKVSESLSVNMEASGNYVVPYSMKTDRFTHLYSVPVTAGIRYTLF